MNVYVKNAQPSQKILLSPDPAYDQIIFEFERNFSEIRVLNMRGCEGRRIVGEKNQDTFYVAPLTG